MKNHTKLLMEWDAFEQEHPDATIHDFCRYYLVRNKEENKNLFGGQIPPYLTSVLAKLISRLGSINWTFIKIALKDIPMEKEWFDYLNTINHFKECKKTFVINYNFSELSTGIDILKRLKKLGYITEKSDPDDKRAKLVRTTPKGEKALQKCYEKLKSISEMVYADISDDEKKLVIQLLTDTEIKNARILMEKRSTSMEELLEKYSKKID